jgi:hypothetical protein
MLYSFESISVALKLFHHLLATKAVLHLVLFAADKLRNRLFGVSMLEAKAQVS